jgi:hypothetical protein
MLEIMVLEIPFLPLPHLCLLLHSFSVSSGVCKQSCHFTEATERSPMDIKKFENSPEFQLLYTSPLTVYGGQIKAHAIMLKTWENFSTIKHHHNSTYVYLNTSSVINSIKTFWAA